MIINQNRKIFIYVLLFLTPLIKIFAHNIEGATIFVASSFVNQEIDFILKDKFISLNQKFLTEENSKATLDNALELIEEAEKQNNIEIIILTNQLIGRIFEKADNFERAKEYYKKGLALLYKNNSSIDILNTQVENDNLLQNNLLLEIGGSYQMLTKNDSALYYYYKILDLPSLHKNASTIKARAYSNIAGIYLELKNYDKAKEFSIYAITIHKNHNNKISASFALSNLASMYLLEEDFDKARETYEEAIDLVKFESSERAIRHKEDLYFNYAWTLYKLKDYEAYTYQELSYEIKDNIRDKGFRNALEEIYAINNVEKVKKEKLLKEVEANKVIWLIVLSGSAIIIALAFIAGFYILRQKNLKLKLSKKELLQNQAIEKLKSISQKRIMNATLDGKETERKDIAETLHDNVSALLSSASLHLQAYKNQFNGTLPTEIEKSQKRITEASQKIRNLSHNLVSSVLLKFGIEFAVRDLVIKYTNSQIKFEAHIDEVSRYNQNFEIKIHNIIQELVNNILKHSEASLASISVDEYDDKLFILISDNGKGFNPKEIQEKEGLGLNQIEARVQMMNGRFFINSSPNKGTDIEIEIPALSEKLQASFS